MITESDDSEQVKRFQRSLATSVNSEREFEILRPSANSLFTRMDEYEESLEVSVTEEHFFSSLQGKCFPKKF